MTGASATQAGTQGIVPAPAVGKQGSYLMGDATWGRDADVLAAIAAGQIGVAKHVTGVEIDLNDFDEPGKYYFGSGGTYANMPDGVTNGYLTVNYTTASGPVQQMLIGHNARIYLRTKGSSSASWTAWTTIANLSDMPGVMTGATESQAGTQGLVPAPAAGKQGSYLMGNGTWGRDADVLAAIAAGQIGNITMQGGSAPNLNDYKTTGCYMFSASQSAAGSNFPASNLTTWLVVLSNGGSPTKQIALIGSTDAIYQRYYTGSTWGVWRRIGTPMPQAAEGVGQWTLLLGGEWDQETDTITPAPLVLPNGGTWAYFGLTWRNDVVTVYAATYAGVAAGGTQIMSAEEHRAHRAMIWRVA